jgi:hypothetical protein
MTEGEDGTSAVETAKLVYLSMRRQGVGIIDTFVSDRGPQWDCESWAHLCRLWKVKRLMSTAFQHKSRFWDLLSWLCRSTHLFITLLHTSLKELPFSARRARCDSWGMDPLTPFCSHESNQNAAQTRQLDPESPSNFYQRTAKRVQKDLNIQAPPHLSRWQYAYLKTGLFCNQRRARGRPKTLTSRH